MPKTEMLEGIVKRVTDGKFGKGLQLEGRPPDEYINQSKFDEEPWPHLDAGMRVRLNIATGKNGKLYLSAEDIEVLDAGPAEPSPNGRVDPYSGEMTPGTFAYKDRMILRQVCLKAAVDYWIGNDGKAKGQVAYEVDDVLVAASRFEDWALRPLVEAATEQDEEREYTGE